GIVHHGVVGQLPLQGQAAAGDILFAEIGAGGAGPGQGTQLFGGVVLDVTVVLAGDQGHLGGQAAEALPQGADGRQVQVDLAVDQVVAAYPETGTAAEFAAGSGADDIDGAADGVLAVEGALGAPQYLDALDVGEIENGPGALAHIDAVQVQTDGALIGEVGGVGLDHAAHGKQRSGGIPLGYIDIEVRGLVAEGVDVDDIPLVDGLGGQGGKGDGGVLQTLFALLGGDQDLLDLGVDGRGHGEHRQQCQGETVGIGVANHGGPLLVIWWLWSRGKVRSKGSEPPPRPGHHRY